MAYKCVNCSELYKDDANELLTGCTKCGKKFFFFIKESRLKEIEENASEQLELNEEEKKQIEQDVREISGVRNENSPVFLDFESVSVIKPGKYVLNLSKLFAKDKPRVYKLEDGKYIVDLSSISKKQSV